MARMSAPKRRLPDSDSDSEAPANPSKPVKRARKSTESSIIPPRTAEQLSNLSHDELIQHVLTLQSQLKASHNSSTTPTAPASSDLSKEFLAKKVAQLRSLMERQIRKSMTWKPSCKTGGATFSQDFLVPAEEVVRQVFRGVVSEKDEKKGWKLKKFGVEEFEKAVEEEIVGSTRYASLYLKGDVTVRYSAENGIMKCSGRYGLM